MAQYTYCEIVCVCQNRNAILIRKVAKTLDHILDYWWMGMEDQRLTVYKITLAAGEKVKLH